MNLYDKLHELFNSKNRFYFPFEDKVLTIPENGIYILFERGEKYQHMDRIVRVGSHTGSNQLRSRLNQHFINENKNRSIFRKNIGRCFLNKDNDPYLKIWELDSTSREDRLKNEKFIDRQFENILEKKISNYIQQNLSFCVFEINDRHGRMFWERKIIATLAGFLNTTPSPHWLGNYSPKRKIREYGLWQVNHLFDPYLSLEEFNDLRFFVRNSK